MTQEHDTHPAGPLPGGEPDDAAEQSTPGSDGDGPEAGYTAPQHDEQGDDAEDSGTEAP